MIVIKNIEISSEKDIAKLSVELNAGHQIFLGHFPDNPILPGVCLIQMIKEILSKIIEKNVLLVKSTSIKFLNFINPINNPTINFDLKIKNTDNNRIQVQCIVFFENTNFCNFRGEFIKITDVK